LQGVNITLNMEVEALVKETGLLMIPVQATTNDAARNITITTVECFSLISPRIL